MLNARDRGETMEDVRGISKWRLWQKIVKRMTSIVSGIYFICRWRHVINNSRRRSAPRSALRSFRPSTTTSTAPPVLVVSNQKEDSQKREKPAASVFFIHHRRHRLAVVIMSLFRFTFCEQAHNRRRVKIVNLANIWESVINRSIDSQAGTSLQHL